METSVLHRAVRGYLVLSVCLQLCLTAQHSADRPACSTGGAAFGIDLLGNSLLVKDPNGYIGSLRLAPATKLLRLSVRGMSGGEKTSEIKLGEIQSGDLVCAVTGEDNAIGTLAEGFSIRAGHATRRRGAENDSCAHDCVGNSRVGGG